MQLLAPLVQTPQTKQPLWRAKDAKKQQLLMFSFPPPAIQIQETHLETRPASFITAPLRLFQS